MSTEHVLTTPDFADVYAEQLIPVWRYVRSRVGGYHEAQDLAQRASSPLSQLTPRELDVLREMAEGKTNGAISDSLFLSESAVEKYSSSVFAKLGLNEEPALHRRVAAVLAFLEHDGRGHAHRRGGS